MRDAVVDWDTTKPSISPDGLCAGPQLKAGELYRIAALMHERFGIDLRDKGGLVSSRLRKKLRPGGFLSFGAYFEHVLADPKGDELTDMVDALTTNHTSFLREQAHFDFLVKHIVPAYRTGVGLEIWSAGCSTGEEPYSIACALLDTIGSGSGIAGLSGFSILATDLSARALAWARQGLYPIDRFAEFPAAWRQAFLISETGQPHGFGRIKPEVARQVQFRRSNLMEPFKHGRKFPVIFCRNVMMYFDRPTQQNLVNRLAACLQPGGYLFVGHSESLTAIEHRLRYVRPATYVLDRE